MAEEAPFSPSRAFAAERAKTYRESARVCAEQMKAETLPQLREKYRRAMTKFLELAEADERLSRSKRPN